MGRARRQKSRSGVSSEKLGIVVLLAAGIVGAGAAIGASGGSAVEVSPAPLAESAPPPPAAEVAEVAPPAPEPEHQALPEPEPVFIAAAPAPPLAAEQVAEEAPVARTAEAAPQPNPAVLKRERLMQRSNSVYSVCEAAAAGDMGVLLARIGEGESLSVRNEQGNTPLHLAAMAGHAEIAAQLLASGADAMATNKAGKLASEVAKNDQVRQVCKQGEAPRRRELEVAESVRTGGVNELREALNSGMNPNALAANGADSLLMVAVGAGQVEAAKLLLAAGANVRYIRPDSRSVLNIAAGVGNLEMLRLLLQAGADPLHRTNHGAYPLHDAIWSGRTALAIELIPYYRDYNFNPEGKGNGYPVAMAIGRGNKAVVEGFIKAGMVVNSPMFNDEPLLTQAVKGNRIEIVRLLLAAGANKAQKDAQGKRAVDYAQGEMKRILQ